MTFFSPTLIGLDIQPFVLKLIQLRKRRQGFMIEQMVYKELPQDIFSEYKIKDWSLLSAILTEIVQDLNLKGGVTAIHLPSNLVRMQRIRLVSGLMDAAIEAEIYTHVQKELPGINETLCIDYTEVVKKEEYSEVFFAAAKQAYLSQYIDCINAAGLKTKIVDVDIYALKRTICFSKESINQSTIQVALYRTAEVATLFAFNSQEIIFYQQWDLDITQTFTVQLKTHLQICLAKIQTIDQFVMCVGKKYNDSGLEECFRDLPIYYPNPFRKLLLTSNVDAVWMVEHAQEFLIALGLAMREIPKW